MSECCIAKNIGTWNVRTLKDEGKLNGLLLEMSRLKIDILSVAETHWDNRIPEAFEEKEYTAPDSSYNDTVIDTFYENLQSYISLVPSNHKLVLIGDWNAKVGKHCHLIWPTVTGKYGASSCSIGGEKLLQFCAINDLSSANTIYRYNLSRIATWLPWQNKKSS